MLLRHSTLLAADAERTVRFEACASRYTARGMSWKASVATLLPAKLLSRGAMSTTWWIKFGTRPMQPRVDGNPELLGGLYLVC